VQQLLLRGVGVLAVPALACRHGTQTHKLLGWQMTPLQLWVQPKNAMLVS
jgi:hypothetical protein